MFGTTRGMLDPARQYFVAFGFAVIASMPLAVRADDSMADVRTLPRLEGAVEERAHTNQYRLNYVVPTAVAVAASAAKKLLVADGWVPYVRPFERLDASLSFKRGRHGLGVSFSKVWGQPDQSTVSYTADRIFANVPFPDDATDIVFNERRPYLGCMTAATVEASLEFFRRELVATGWSPLSTTDAAARYPTAIIDDKIGNGVRAFYSYEKRDGGSRRPPIMLSLQRRDDGKTSVDVRIAPFALPTNLERARETAGLPVPDDTTGFGSTGDASSVHRKLEGTIVAEIPAVLAFYRRELVARNWKEESRGAVVARDQAVLNFSSTDQVLTLRLDHKYDLTALNLVTQMTEAGLAARAKAKKEADENFFRDAAATAKQIIAADEVRRAAQAANLSDAPLRTLADKTAPVPLPETAENVTFDGADGRLEFESSASVKALATFYRASLKSTGWNERRSGINTANMVTMEFSKGGKALSFIAMQMGPKVNVRANGTGLVVANAKPGATGGQASSGAATKAVVQNLENDPDAPFPVPKQRSAMSTSASGKLPGSDARFRRQLDASIPAELSTVLAFYRSELGKREWKESAERAVVQADRVELAFTSPDGPALLKLGRSKDETSVSLMQKYPAVAAKADMIPRPGQAKIMFGNMGGSEAAVTINKQTIKLAAEAGGLQSPRPPVIELPPGKYRYLVKVAGRPTRNDTIEVTADDAWGLIVSPSGGALSLQMY